MNYRRNTEGFQLRHMNEFPIEVQLSLIPALKQYIAAVNSEQQQKDLSIYISETIPSFLNSMAMACAESPGTYRFEIPGGMHVQLEVGIHASSLASLTLNQRRGREINARIDDMFSVRVSNQLFRVFSKFLVLRVSTMAH
jgi:hypothetical protein